MMDGVTVMERKQTPKQIHLLAALFVVIGILTIWAGYAGIVPVEDIDPMDEFNGVLNPNVVSYATIAMGIVAGSP